MWNTSGELPWALLAAELRTHIVEVDDHGAVAHVRGLVVGLAAGWESHSSRAGADRHAQGRAGGLGRRAGVTHHQTFPLQDDGLGVILPAGLQRTPEQERTQQGQEVKAERAEVHHCGMLGEISLLDSAVKRCHFG